MKRHPVFLHPSLPLALLVLTAAPGCASRGSGQPGTVGAPDGGSVPAESPRTTMVYPDGWEKIELVANYAKTRITSSAHFVTTRNACGKDADGALTMEVWNQLAGDINAALKSEPSKTPICKDRPDHSKMDGTAVVHLTGGAKRLIMENRGGWEYCTDIADSALADRVFSELSLLVLIADREECSGGWGSGT